MHELISHIDVYPTMHRHPFAERHCLLAFIIDMFFVFLCLVAAVATMYHVCYFSDEPHTKVHGSIINGIFAGRIHTPSGTYFVDKSEIYYEERPPFHSVIYHESHIDGDHPRFFAATLFRLAPQRLYLK